jgi:hypothetical protein
VSERLAQMIQFYHNLVSMQMKTTMVADIISDLTDVSERLAQMIQFFIITLFICRLLFVMKDSF